MTASDTGRSYHSELRAEQAEQTRQGILRALAAVMADGPAAVTIPAVAEAAGVSIPTVYRHFGDKAGLISAMVPFVGERLGMADEVPPADLSEVDQAVRRLFHRLDQADPLIRAALASGASAEVRRESVEVRMEMLDDMLAGVALELDATARERLARVIVVMTCSDSLRLWQDRFDLDVDAVADHVSWAIRGLIAGVGQ